IEQVAFVVNPVRASECPLLADLPRESNPRTEIAKTRIAEVVLARAHRAVAGEIVRPEPARCRIHLVWIPARNAISNFFVRRLILPTQAKIQSKCAAYFVIV